MPFELTSAAFGAGQAIPSRYTCDGDDASPPLQWSEPPPGTRSLALVLEDPDAPRGPWVHWVVHGVRPDVTGLPEACSGTDGLPEGSAEGRNSWGRTRYNGPCPPSGTHRYYFRLTALDAELDVPHGAAREDLRRAMDGHVLAEATLMGTYGRQ